MDWKRLVQFALVGSSGLEQYAILLVRVSIGLFFAISGANKLFVAGGTKPVYETLVKAEVPFPQQMAYFVSGVEFVGGSLVTVGFLSSVACVALLIDMIVATLTSAVSTLAKGLSPLNWLDDFLYLPEVLYVLFFIWLICSGPESSALITGSPASYGRNRSSSRRIGRTLREPFSLFKYKHSPPMQRIPWSTIALGSLLVLGPLDRRTESGISAT